MVETGRVIQRRYLLQRLLKQGQVCAVYQGTDQVLQRSVVVKVAPAEHISAYRAAIRTTSQFTHPNIIGIYDLIVEPEALYIVQEYVDGEEFSALLQNQQTPYQVADLGAQICQALLYAGSPSRKVCHGDLTPSAVVRDRRGMVRVNNFALPSDMYYFSSWAVVGGDGKAVSDRDLPFGRLSEERREDDVRAVGLLLYQLLMARTPGTTGVEPPSDGRLRFTRNVPAELCEVVARTVVRQHPQHIALPEDLHRELRALTDVLEPPAPVNTSAYQTEENQRQYSSASRSGSVGVYEGSQAGTPLSTFSEPQYGQSGVDAAFAANAANVSVKLASPQQPLYAHSQMEHASTRRINLPLLILSCLILFALFFAVGFFLANQLLH